VWGAGLGLAVGLGLAMGLLGADGAPELPSTPPLGVSASPPSPAAAATAPSRAAPNCASEPDPALTAQLAEAEGELARLQARNDAADGPVQSWPAEAEARLAALEDATTAVLAAQGLTVLELDCGERPCLLSIEGPVTSGGPTGDAWIAPLEAGLAGAGVSAERVRSGVRFWPDEAIEGVLLLMPEGVPLDPEARGVAHRRVQRMEEERMFGAGRP
jgi:hypothetical protein